MVLATLGVLISLGVGLLVVLSLRDSSSEVVEEPALEPIVDQSDTSTQDADEPPQIPQVVIEADSPIGVEANFNLDQVPDFVQVIDPSLVEGYQIYLYQVDKPDTCTYMVTSDLLDMGGLPPRDIMRINDQIIDPQLKRDFWLLSDNLAPVHSYQPRVIAQDCGDFNFVRVVEPEDMSKWLAEIKQKRPLPTITEASTRPLPPTPKGVPPGIIRPNFNADDNLDLIQIVDPDHMENNIYLFASSSPETCRVKLLRRDFDSSPYTQREVALVSLEFHVGLMEDLVNINGYLPVTKLTPWIITSGCGDMRYFREANEAELAGYARRVLDMLTENRQVATVGRRLS